jgi:NDP-sugar pyrophosphorylase family protein
MLLQATDDCATTQSESTPSQNPSQAPASKRSPVSMGVPGVHGIVLAGTHHWGDTPFERQLRGPLMPVALSPLVSHPMMWLREGGVRAVTLCANSGTARVREVFEDGARLGMSVNYYEDLAPRGAAGCARDAALATDAQTFVVVEGSMIPSVNLPDLLAAHRNSGAAATTVTEIDRRRNQITRVRPQSPGGIYIFERRVLEQVAATGYQDIKEVLVGKLYKSGEQVSTYEVQGVAPRVIDYETYMAVNRWLVERAAREHWFADFERRGDALCHPSARISPDALIVGPALIGPGVVLERDAVVVGPTAIGQDCRIRHAALVSRSVLWQGCTVGQEAYVDSSLLAEGVRIDAGRQLNYDLEIAPAAEGASWSARLSAASLLPLLWEGARASLSLLTTGRSVVVRPEQA